MYSRGSQVFHRYVLPPGNHLVDLLLSGFVQFINNLINKLVTFSQLPLQLDDCSLKNLI